MFGGKPSEDSAFQGRSDNGAPVTLIAKGVKVEGEFASQGDVVIEGEVHGTLNCAGLLTVGAEAKIKADVRAGDALVAGSIEGNVTVMRRLELEETAKIIGDVTCEVVMVKAGASLTGRMMVGRKPEEVRANVPNVRRGERANVAAAAS
jgi:cytoskeletal protein CcmA (bactofilin family)